MNLLREKCYVKKKGQKLTRSGLFLTFLLLLVETAATFRFCITLTERRSRHRFVTYLHKMCLDFNFTVMLTLTENRPSRAGVNGAEVIDRCTD